MTYQRCIFYSQSDIAKGKIIEDFESALNYKFLINLSWHNDAIEYKTVSRTVNIK